MTAHKPTPGPWGVLSLSDGGINNLVGIPGRALAMAVVTESTGEAEANANLIASAPDLLAACEAALANKEAELNRAPRPMPDPQVAILLQDALKKARGGA